MKSFKLFLPLFLIIMTFVNPTSAQSSPKKSETVWVIINRIKDSSKTDYEKWMTDIFFAPMKTSVDPILKKQYNATRWLKPVQQNEDKTWTYSFLMDPVIENGDYDIESFLIKIYGETKGKAYMKEYESFMASDAHFHSFKN